MFNNDKNVGIYAKKESSMKVFCVINTLRIAFEPNGSSLITCEDSSPLALVLELVNCI